jgi:hypothetical protein
LSSQLLVTLNSSFTTQTVLVSPELRRLLMCNCLTDSWHFFRFSHSENCKKFLHRVLCYIHCCVPTIVQEPVLGEFAHRLLLARKVTELNFTHPLISSFCLISVCEGKNLFSNALTQFIPTVQWNPLFQIAITAAFSQCHSRICKNHFNSLNKQMTQCVSVIQKLATLTFLSCCCILTVFTESVHVFVTVCQLSHATSIGDWLIDCNWLAVCILMHFICRNCTCSAMVFSIWCLKLWCLKMWSLLLLAAECALAGVNCANAVKCKSCQQQKQQNTEWFVLGIAWLNSSLTHWICLFAGAEFYNSHSLQCGK